MPGTTSSFNDSFTIIGLPDATTSTIFSLFFFFYKFLRSCHLLTKTWILLKWVMYVIHNLISYVRSSSVCCVFYYFHEALWYIKLRNNFYWTHWFINKLCLLMFSRSIKLYIVSNNCEWKSWDTTYFLLKTMQAYMWKVI